MSRAPGRAAPRAPRAAPRPAPPARRRDRPRRSQPPVLAPNIGECIRFERLAVAQVHVHAARQARVEAPDRAHDVDAAEVVRPVLLEDRLARDRVLVRARRPVGVRRAAVPRRRRVRVVVGDLAVADHQVVREHAAHRLVEAAADGLVGDVEVLEDLRSARRAPRRAPGRRSAAPSPPRRRRSRPARGRARSRWTTAGPSTRSVRLRACPASAGSVICTPSPVALHVRRVDLVRPAPSPTAGPARRRRCRAPGGRRVRLSYQRGLITQSSCRPRGRASAAWGSSSGSTGGAGRPGCPSGSLSTNVSSLAQSS